MMRPPLVIAFCVVFGVLKGCVADGPRQPPAPPSDLQPVRLLVAATQPEDTDGNRLADTTRLTMYIFGDEMRFALPIHTEGAFLFRLTDARGREYYRWSFTPEQVQAARIRTGPGPGYGFVLSLNRQGSTDRIPDGAYDVLVTFTPTTGRPVNAQTGATLIFGRVSR